MGDTLVPVTTPVSLSTRTRRSRPRRTGRAAAVFSVVLSALLLFVLIALAVYVPAMVRGEKLLPDHSGGEAQWIGGPRQGVAELPAPDGDDSRAGGASGSW
jgi:hypothetical protein